MSEDNNIQEEATVRKLCSNCAYRANCNKRFSVTVVNGEVRCLEYARDLSLKADRGNDS